MSNSRRTFIKKSTFALAGSSLLSRVSFANTNMKGNELEGIQLYSARDDMGKDPSGTLKQLAAMGYKHVEHANYKDRKFYGYTPAEFKKILDGLGMKMPVGIRYWVHNIGMPQKKNLRLVEIYSGRCSHYGTAICYQPIP